VRLLWRDADRPGALPFWGEPPVVGLWLLVGDFSGGGVFDGVVHRPRRWVEVVESARHSGASFCTEFTSAVRQVWPASEQGASVAQPQSSSATIGRASLNPIGPSVTGDTA
jgi:hypothetical protein